jgi:hypothetical protein
MALVHVIDDGREAGEIVRMRSDRLVIGRAAGDIVVPHDICMSPTHAAIERLEEGGWLLRDLGSAVGTFVRVTSARLVTGTVIQVGRTQLRFEETGPTSGWLVERAADPGVTLWLNWLPGETPDSLDRRHVEGQRRGAAAVLRDGLPDRLARTLCEQAVAPPAGDLAREARRSLAALVTATPLAITGDRGFTAAEATAGGVPLAEVRLETMESRICPGLYLAGEVLDVDGRIGGFNFQWAWASGFVAGSAAAAAADEPTTTS